jgi:hypothetical protein
MISVMNGMFSEHRGTPVLLISEVLVAASERTHCAYWPPRLRYLPLGTDAGATRMLLIGASCSPSTTCRSNQGIAIAV